MKKGMKIVMAFGALALVAAVGWLAMKQQKLHQRVVTLEAENKTLAETVAQQSNLSPELIAQTEARLENARAALAATEQRLTNVLAQAGPATHVLPSRVLPSRSLRQPVSARDAFDDVPGFDRSAPRPPASSHSPGGQLLDRSWGPEQVVGHANTDRAGDISTAWASRQPDGGEEWLHVNYDRPVDISEIRVRETYNPGAISKITALLPNGQEITVWEGVEPPATAPVETAFAPQTRVQANSVKIYMDTRRVPGWNEIDAVELIGSDGTRQWATSATASSTYAEP
jgi:hypothetical protein